MKNFNVLSSLTVVFMQINFAQTGTIKGTVFDSESKLVLAGASIVVAGTTLGTTTFADGTFILENVPVGRAIVSVTLVGYSPLRTELNVTADKVTEATIFLDPAAIPLLPVVVTATTAKERQTPATFSNLGR